MTNTLSLGNKTVRPHGRRMAMSAASRLERVLARPELYDIDVGGGVAKISSHGGACLDRTDIQRIQTSVDLEIFYVHEDAIYVTRAMK